MKDPQRADTELPQVVADPSHTAERPLGFLRKRRAWRPPQRGLAVFGPRPPSVFVPLTFLPTPSGRFIKTSSLKWLHEMVFQGAHRRGNRRVAHASRKLQENFKKTSRKLQERFLETRRHSQPPPLMRALKHQLVDPFQEGGRARACLKAATCGVK